MAGRPQQKRAQPRNRAKIAPRRPVLTRPAVGISQHLFDANPGQTIEPRRTGERMVDRLSSSYGYALGTDLSIREASSAEGIQKALLAQAAARNAGKVRISDVVAAAMIARSADRGARDGVAAARELADRTEGPVVQRVESASVRYVVSVSPTNGAPGEPLTLAEWESAARESDVAARALSEAQVRITQGSGQGERR